MLGGVTVNLILGFLIYMMILFVWGKNTLTNEALPLGLQPSPIAQAIGFESGDKILRVDGAELEPVLEGRLAERLGYEVACFVRSLDDLVAIVGDLPPLDPAQKHQVVFFARPPGEETKAAYEDAAGATDDLRWRERELLWTHRGGMLDSPLGDALQRLIPPVNTVRTGATIERLVARSR